MPVVCEICRTLEPGIGAGFRDWEVEIANEAGPAVETFNAGFHAPGINRVFRVVLPLGTGDFFNSRYPGPTLPLFGVFSTLWVPVTLASSIVDPPISDIPVPFGTFFDPAVSNARPIRPIARASRLRPTEQGARARAHRLQ